MEQEGLNQVEDLKQLYQIARNISPGQALDMARNAETAEERNFYVFISDMNLQRAQREYIKNEHKLYEKKRGAEDGQKEEL